MRRLIASTKKVFRKNQPLKNEVQIQIQDAQDGSFSTHEQEELESYIGATRSIDLSLPEGPLSGFTCWDKTQCNLCSCFLDPWFVLRMFTNKFAILGTPMDLLAWSQAGGRCPLCIYVLSKFIEETKEVEVSLDAKVVVRWNTKDKAIKGGRRDEVSSFDFELNWGYPHSKTRSVLMSCFVNEDQQFSQYITTRPVNPNVSSPMAFFKAKKWLVECVEGHEQCNRRQAGYSEMPSRVLEILKKDSGDYFIRLRESLDETFQYVALSYIWGMPQTFQTLRANLEDQKRQIDVSSLPKTILDAITCTEQLGLKYLWVDSLCIIQDSVEDKTNEISRMSIIYKNAYVTISAAKAKHCNEGFLESRSATTDLFQTSFQLDVLTPKDPAKLNEWIDAYRIKDDFSNYLAPHLVEAAYKVSDFSNPTAWHDTPSTVFINARPHNAKDDMLTAPSIDNEPISKRGWTLQESWLSPRMLIYGSAQLIWKCSAGQQVDGGLLNSSNSRDIRTSYQIDEKGFMINLDGSTITPSHKKLIFRLMWQKIVQESAQRELTVPGDKLNALEGIVQEIRRQTGDEYLAGLWRQSLLEQLTWYQDASCKDSDKLLWSKERTCPSWSWTKTDGPLRFACELISSVVVEDARITRNEITGEYPDSRLVVEGSITLRAPLSTLPVEKVIPTFRFLNPGASKQAFTNVLYLDGGLTNPDFISENVDGSIKLLVPEHLRFLELNRGKIASSLMSQESRGLVLLPVEGQANTYRRAGFFVIALEYDIDEVGQPNLLFMLSAEPRNMQSTAFGIEWTESLVEEIVTIV